MTTIQRKHYLSLFDDLVLKMAGFVEEGGLYTVRVCIAMFVNGI